MIPFMRSYFASVALKEGNDADLINIISNLKLERITHIIKTFKEFVEREQKPVASLLEEIRLNQISPHATPQATPHAISKRVLNILLP